MIALATHLPLPGCPTINGGTEWALWIPRASQQLHKTSEMDMFILATVFEFILFLFAAYKACTSIAARMRVNQRLTLVSVLIQGNTLYFFR